MRLDLDTFPAGVQERETLAHRWLVLGDARVTVMNQETGWPWSWSVRCVDQPVVMQDMYLIAGRNGRA